MTQTITVRDVISQLAADGLLDETGKARAEAFVESRTFVQPWYIRTMVGFGAWLASLLLIGFVAGFVLFQVILAYLTAGVSAAGSAASPILRAVVGFLDLGGQILGLAGRALARPPAPYPDSLYLFALFAPLRCK